MNIIRQIPRKLPATEYVQDSWDVLGLDESGLIYYSDECFLSEQSAQTAIDEGTAKFFEQLSSGEVLDEARRLFEPKPEVKFTPEMIEAIYAAWKGAGVDIAGGNWRRFVGMLPT